MSEYREPIIDYFCKYKISDESDIQRIRSLSLGKTSDSDIHKKLQKLTLKPKERQIALKMGAKHKEEFSPKESQIVDQNFENFCNDFPDTERPTERELFGYFHNTNPKIIKTKRKAIRMFVRITEFYLRLSKGLNNRTISQIYRFRRNKISDLSSINALTNKQKKQLIISNKRLIKIRQTSHDFNIDYKKANDFHRKRNKRFPNHMKRKSWTEAEDKKLMKLINGKSQKEIKWAQIAINFDQRSDQSIRDRYFSSKFQTKLTKKQMKRWSHEDYNRLIIELYKIRYNGLKDINWQHLKTLFPDFNRQLIKRHVNEIKRKAQRIGQTFKTFIETKFRELRGKSEELQNLFQTV